MYRIYFIDNNVKIYDSQYEAFDDAWKRYNQVLDIGTYNLHERSIPVNVDSLEIKFEEYKYKILN